MKRFKLNLNQDIEIPSDHLIFNSVLIASLASQDIDPIVYSTLHELGYQQSNYWFSLVWKLHGHMPDIIKLGNSYQKFKLNQRQEIKIFTTDELYKDVLAAILTSQSIESAIRDRLIYLGYHKEFLDPYMGIWHKVNHRVIQTILL